MADIARLQELADYLGGTGRYVKRGPVPPEKFDLSHWSIETTKYIAQLENEIDIQPRKRSLKDRVKAVTALMKGGKAFTTIDPHFKFTRDDEIKVLPLVRQNACRTTACAMGHATMIPKFRKAGLGLTKDFDIFLGARYMLVYQDPEGKVHEAFAAAAAFFGIDEDESQHLFDPAYYEPNHRRDPKYVVARLNKLIKDKKASVG